MKWVETGEFGECTPFDAIAAMNRLKRASINKVADASHKPSTIRREQQLLRFALIAHQYMHLLPIRFVALAVNAVAASAGPRIAGHVHTSTQSKGGAARPINKPLLLRAAAKRCCALSDPLAYNPQAVSMILNAMAKLGLHDQALLQHLSAIVRQLGEGPHKFSAQSIAVIVNAYAKLEQRDDELLEYMARVALGTAPPLFSPQAVGTIVNAYAKLQPAREHVQAEDMGHEEVLAEQVLRHMVAAVVATEPRDMDWQAVANILNGFGRVTALPRPGSRLHSLAEKTLWPHLEAAIKVLPGARAPAQALANIFNACVKMDLALSEDTRAALSRACLSLKPQAFGGQDVSHLTHALSRLRRRDMQLLRHVLSSLTLARTPPAAFPRAGRGGGRARAQGTSNGGRAPELTTQALTSILHALATLHVWPREVSGGGSGGEWIVRERQQYDARRSSGSSAMEREAPPPPCPLEELFIAQIEALAAESLTAQDVGNLAWSIGVLRLSHPMMLDKVWRGIAHSGASMQLLDLRYVHVRHGKQCCGV